MKDGLLIAIIAAVASVFGAGFWGVLKAWRERIDANRTADVKREEHRDSLTFDVIDVAREEIRRLNAEAAQLRPLVISMAHLEEALDHLHAMLHAEGEAEAKAAATRARAFLRRMRPQVGDLRNAAQVRQSAETLAGSDAHEGTAAVGRKLSRKGPATGDKS